MDSEKLLGDMISGKPMSLMQQIGLTVRLSIPAILAQISSIVMQYIDASMVGRLGANASGAIGLVSSTTWLFGGICSAITCGFTVQIAQAVGAGKDQAARNIMKQGLVVSFAISLILGLIGGALSGKLPVWLGGDETICKMAGTYFMIYILALPAFQLNSIAGGMHQSAGNMRLPGVLNIICCILDVVFNMLFIFPGMPIHIRGLDIRLPGLGLGVAGAALGTITAEIATDRKSVV